MFLDGERLCVISRKPVVLKAQGSACGHGGSHICAWCWSPSHCDSKSDTSEKRWPLAIMMTFKSCRMRNPGKAKTPNIDRVRFDCQVF